MAPQTPDLVALRREFHQHPEVGLDLPWTQQRILQELEGLGLEITTGTDCSSVTAVLHGREGGPTVLLRGDMDALPVQEDTGLDFSSRIDGAMHACGHDLHMTMLLGAVHELVQRRDELQGDVIFMFQPGEEGWDGASVMLREGVLDAGRTPVVAAYGLHVFSAMVPRRYFGTRQGPLMAASDGLHVRVVGAGGHGSAPHRAKDPVAPLAEMITALQTTITRRFNALDPVVASVGYVRAGSKRNIIPGEALFEATVRSFSPESRDLAERELSRTVEGIAQAHGVDVEVQYQREYPPTINDASEAEFAVQTAASVLGEERAGYLADPFMGSEDFSRVLEEVPGAFVAVGAVTEDGDPESSPFNHSPQAVFDEAVLPDGARVLAQLAVDRLAQAVRDGAGAPTAEAEATASDSPESAPAPDMAGTAPAHT